MALGIRTNIGLQRADGAGLMVLKTCFIALLSF